MIKSEIICSDNLAYLKTLPDNSIDSIVTDSPYGLGKPPDMIQLLTHWLNDTQMDVKGKGFMNKEWDAFVPQPLFWKECFRVLKHGGHLLSFFGTRTFDIGTLAIRMGGFEIRDTICWLYATGFPKSLDISKSMDKESGIERKIINKSKNIRPNSDRGNNLIYGEYGYGKDWNDTIPATDLAKQWDGWGTALKPAFEPIIIARKPIEKGLTIAQNIAKWGTGGIYIDGCRIEIDEDDETDNRINTDYRLPNNAKNNYFSGIDAKTQLFNSKGRFPANLILDETAAEMLDKQTGNLKSGEAEIGTGREGNHSKGIYGAKASKIASCYADEGGASRFFYCAKASKQERNFGLQPSKSNTHPTIKPVELCRWLVRLVTPPNGTCLDPFNGSGTTGIACKLENINYLGIEQSEYDCEVSRTRIAA